MTTTQIISIIVSIIAASVIIAFSIVTNTPKAITIEDNSNDGDDEPVDDNINRSQQTFSLKDIVKSVTNQ